MLNPKDVVVKTIQIMVDVDADELTMPVRRDRETCDEISKEFGKLGFTVSRSERFSDVERTQRTCEVFTIRRPSPAPPAK
jgi:hypothetical protein